MPTFWRGTGGLLHRDQFNEWNTVKIDGVVFPSKQAPCLATVKVSVEYEVDNKGRKSKNGAKTVKRRLKPAVVTVTLTMWTDAQYQAYKRALELLHPKFDPNEDKYTAHKLEHPDAADALVQQVALVGFTSIEDAGESGVRTATLRFEEVFEGASTAKKPSNKKIEARQVGVDKRAQSGDAAIPTEPIEKTEIGPGDE